MQNAKQLLAATRARSVPAPLDGAVVHSPFAALRQSDGEKFGKRLAERGKRRLAPAPVESESVEIKDGEGRIRMRCHKGVIVVNPGS